MTWVAHTFATAAIYLIVIASVSPADIAFAVVLGAAIALLCRPRPTRDDRRRPRVLAWLVFALASVRELLRGSLTVIAVLVGLRSWRRAGLVDVPLGERTRLGTAISGLVVSASPGTALVDVDDETRTMLIHTIDASDPEETRRRLEVFYQRYQKAVLP